MNLQQKIHNFLSANPETKCSCLMRKYFHPFHLFSRKTGKLHAYALFSKSSCYRQPQTDFCSRGKFAREENSLVWKFEHDEVSLSRIQPVERCTPNNHPRHTKGWQDCERGWINGLIWSNESFKFNLLALKFFMSCVTCSVFKNSFLHVIYVLFVCLQRTLASRVGTFVLPAFRRSPLKICQPEGRG